MKLSLFAVCFMGAAFFTLSETSHAAPFAAGFHVSVLEGFGPAGAS